MKTILVKGKNIRRHNTPSHIMTALCPALVLFFLTLCGCLMILYHTVSFWMGIITGCILVVGYLLLLIKNNCHSPHYWDCVRGGLICSTLSVFVCVLSCIIIGGVQYSYNTTVCTFKECCTDSWITPNITGLSLLLHEKVFGQHIAVSTIIKLLKGHLETGSTKPLVLSLHGPSGSGKSYVTQFIIENMYSQGKDSQFVHFLSPMTDIPNTHDMDSYKSKLKSQIEEGVKQCPRSMFVFDMVEDMPAGVLDVLHPALDLNHQVNSVDYNKAMFIFLSKTGHVDITHGVTQNKNNGSQRRQLSLNDFERKIKRVAYESKNGLYKSNLISSNLVSAFVPFLPLERIHVKQCIAQELIKKDIYKFDHQVDAEEVDIIADQLHYTSDGGFSETGCKGVIEKINIVSRDE